MSNAEAPILELSTLAPNRPDILLRWSGEPEGKLYPMIEIDDMSLDQQAEIAGYSEIIKKLEKKKSADDITVPEAKKLSGALGALVKYLIPSLEDQAFAELTDGAKAKIVEAFILASPELMKAVREGAGKTSASR